MNPPIGGEGLLAVDAQGATFKVRHHTLNGSIKIFYTIPLPHLTTKKPKYIERKAI
jgi:hypothetical protein